MMREAQKMMQDPAFQAQCDKMMANDGFKQAMTKTKEDLKDPEKVKELEEKAQKAIAEGDKDLAVIEAELEAKRNSVAKQAVGASAPQINNKKKKKKKKKKKAVLEKGEKDDDKEDEEQEEVPDIPSLNIN
jgi:hypothetical protein